MPWKRSSKEEQRFDLVRQMLRGKVQVSVLCREFGVSRQTAYKWKQRYRSYRLRGLEDRSRRPQGSPQQISAQWQRRIKAARLRNETWGARKLRDGLVRRFGEGGSP